MARHTRTDWLEQGLLLLVEIGAEALTIDAMCAHLKVTKGSFYHHFANREAFLEALLEFWEEHYTRQFIEFSGEGQTPAEKLARLHEMVIKNHAGSEVVIRAWAQRDPLARGYLARVDAQRIAYLTELHLALTGDEAYARTMARMVYAILIGAEAMIPTLTREELAEVYALLDRMARKTKDDR